MKPHADRSVFITGASSGIGRALALEFAAAGYSVVVTARRLDRLEALKREMEALSGAPGRAAPRILARELDVRDYEAVSRVFREAAGQLGGIDIVIANAGIGHGEMIGEGSFSNAQGTVETNLLGAMATIDAAVAYFLGTGALRGGDALRGGEGFADGEEKGEHPAHCAPSHSRSGQIVGISSVAAFRGIPGSSAYSAAKAGLNGYLESLRAELVGTGVWVSAVYPGFVDTGINRHLPHRPFLIGAERAARSIRRSIERRHSRVVVPWWPWFFLIPVLRVLPTRIVARLKGRTRL